MHINFEDRVVLVTGAATGLGRAYAMWFAARGAKVIVNNRVHPPRPEGAAPVVNAIIAAGGEAILDNHDVSQAGAGAAMVAKALETYGRLDVVVANAANNTRRSALELTLDELRNGMNANFWGSVEPVIAALPYMVKADYGRIVLTTSAAGLFGQREHAAYAAAKMAVTGFGRALAIDVAKRNIRVNMLSPYAWTEMAKHVLPPEMEKTMAPVHVAEVVGWLSSEKCSINGQIIAAGAGRVRRNAIVEGPIVALDADGFPSAWPSINALSTISESRNSGHSALELIPELKQSKGR